MLEFDLEDQAIVLGTQIIRDELKVDILVLEVFDVEPRVLHQFYGV